MERNFRRITLTDEGELILSRGVPALETIEEIWDDLSKRRKLVTGHLRVLAPNVFGRRYVANVAGKFQARYPDLKLDLILSDSPTQEKATKVDITIHIGERKDSSLLMRKLAPNRRLLCASPAFIEEYGVPLHPEGLGNYRNIVIRENQEDVTHYCFKHGAQETSVRVAPMLVSNDGTVARQWALDGLGLLIRSEWHVTEDLKSGRLVEVLPEYKLPDADVVALFGFRQGRAYRTRMFFKELQKSLSPIPWR